MEEKNKIPKEGRSLSNIDKRSAKYRNKKGPAKYFSPYNNINYIQLEDTEPEDVSVPVAQLRKELNQKVWDSNNKLKPEVRKALIDIAYSYFEALDLDFKVKEIYFTGSLSNYGWTDGSDIDLHIIVEYGELGNIPFLDDYLYLKKKNWMDNHNISIYGFEVEPFVKDKEGIYDYKTIYSVLNDNWVVAPRRDKPLIDFETVKEKSASIMNSIDKIAEINDAKEKFNAAEKLKNKLGGIRAIGLNTGGEYSNENLIYKTLRRSGYLDKLGDTKHSAFDSQYTINESVYNEIAKSKSQQRFFGMVKSCKDDENCASKSIKNTADSMKKSDINDFASTKHKNLKNKVSENEKITNLGVTPIVHTLKVQSGINKMTSEKIEIVKDFINFVYNKLKMKKQINICLRRGRDEFIETTASYVPSNNTNHIRCNGRALVDILRSIAHELTHAKQREVGVFGDGDKVQNIGGHIENQANSVAGIFIKDFTHNYGYNNIYDI